MSWLFGYVGAVTPALRTKLQRLHEAPLFGSAGADHYVQAGGLSATCRGGLTHNGTGQWIVTGLGLDPSQHCVLDDVAWQNVLSAAHPALDSVDGHFVAATVQGGAVGLYCDQLGTRTLHYASFAEGCAFSTRLDWLAKLPGGLDVDYEAFGSHWLAFNQLSTRSQVLGLSRLGPGGHLALRSGTRKAYERVWTCSIGESDREGTAFARALAGYCTPTGLGQVSLGLSGGLDSRILLALGARRTHVFGPLDHPDVRIAQRIVSRMRIPQRHIHKAHWDADSALALLRARSRTTQVVSAASSVLDMNYYARLHEEGLGIIDGGFGEVARRQFMNRLLRLGRGWDDPAQVLPHISVERAAVFSKDATATMMRGAQEEIARQRDLLPSGLDAENTVDLIGVRTRLPNFFGLEQNRLDGMGACYMPFAQPSVLRALFQVPLALRRNGKLFKQLIRSRCPSLARHPLVKDTTTFPFWLPTMGAILASRIKKKAGLAYLDPRPRQFLQTVKPFVLDLVHSDAVRTCAAYDVDQLHQIVLDYYGGQEALAGAVDWWLAFEMWRRVVQDEE